MALFKTSGVDIVGAGINIGAVYGTLSCTGGGSPRWKWR